MSKKLSSGFSGNSTRTMGEVETAIEARYQSRTKSLDVFTDDFSPPGVSETGPGENVQKSALPYEKPHDDFPAGTPTRDLAAAGNAREQPELDEIDETEYKINAPIKKYRDQFPGSSLKSMNDRIESKMKKLVSGTEKSDNADTFDQRNSKTLAASDNAAYDIGQTDARKFR